MNNNDKTSTAKDPNTTSGHHVPPADLAVPQNQTTNVTPPPDEVKVSSPQDQDNPFLEDAKKKLHRLRKKETAINRLIEDKESGKKLEETQIKKIHKMFEVQREMIAMQQQIDAIEAAIKEPRPGRGGI